MQLAAENLSIERGGRLVLAGLSFSVAGGGALVLTGPNGAGKTTLIRAIAGFQRPSTGQIRLEGGAADASIAEQCHLVGHRDAIKPALTVVENARFWTRYLGGSDATIAPALDRIGLAPLAGVPAAYLSAGQRRRLGLVRLLLAPRPLWLLDEPTVSLDAAGCDMLAAIVTAHVVGGGIVVAATHIPLGIDRAAELRLAPAAGVHAGEQHAGGPA